MGSGYQQLVQEEQLRSRDRLHAGQHLAAVIIGRRDPIRPNDRRAHVSGTPSRRRPGDARQCSRLSGRSARGAAHYKSIEDLKGKRVGISRFGAASHMRVLNFLPRFGLGEKDVTFLQIGDTPARVVALVGGSIDASSFSPPDHLAATKAGMKILFNMRELNVAYQGTGLVTTQRQIAKNRDVVRRMVKAYVEAIHLVRTNPEISKRAFAKYRKTNDEKQLDEAYDTLREMVRPKPYPSMDGFKTIFKDVSDRIPTARTANPKEFIEASFLEELDRSGYIDGLYR